MRPEAGVPSTILRAGSSTPSDFAQDDTKIRHYTECLPFPDIEPMRAPSPDALRRPLPGGEAKSCGFSSPTKF